MIRRDDIDIDMKIEFGALYLTRINGACFGYVFGTRHLKNRPIKESHDACEPIARCSQMIVEDLVITSCDTQVLSVFVTLTPMLALACQDIQILQHPCAERV